MYKGSRHRFALAGDFVKVSVRRTRPNNWLRKGKKSKAVVIRTRFRSHRVDGSYVRT